ncbi:MAG: hypothetical protein R6X02_27870 [Enhygromyxa sp.]
MPTRVVDVAVANHSCALFDSGHVKCWGPNDFGQLGLGMTETIGDDELPADLDFVALDGCATAISVSARGHSCAALESGSVQCWGRNDYGELGLGHTEAIGDDELPSDAEPLVFSSPAIAVTTGGASSCALLASGDITCWGSNLCGRLGFADAPEFLGDDELVTGVLVEQKSRASALYSGAQMNCLTDEAQMLTCWGATTHQLGHLPGEDPLAPYGCHPPIEATPHQIADPVVEVGIANAHACALDIHGQLWCWGDNFAGELGYGDEVVLIFPDAPVDVGVPISRVSAGGSTTCIVSEDHRVRCWGSGNHGKLGQASEDNLGKDEVPASIPFIEVGAEVEIVAPGIAHTCVVTTTGEVRCWGSGAAGRLGLGNEDNIGDDELPSAVGPVPLL